MVCEDCLTPEEWWKELETSERYVRKKCGMCGKEEVVEQQVRCCDCGGEFLGWKPKF